MYGSCLALALIAAVVGGPATAALAVDGRTPPLVLDATIPLEGVAGRIDHMAVDLDKQRLLVAELGNNTVDVIDLKTQRAIHRIKDLHEPQGVAAAGVIVVANGGDGSVVFFGADDFASLGSVELDEDADNVRVDARTGRVVVGYGSGALAIIDPVGRSKNADIPLAAHPEGFQLTRDGGRIFINIPDANQIAVVAAGRQIASWSVPHLHSNFPLALDASETMIAVVFRSPQRLVLLDALSGAVHASVETCGDADDAFFDGVHRRIYVSCGEGMVDVFDQTEGKLRRLARVETSSGARTALFVPEFDRLFVAMMVRTPLLAMWVSMSRKPGRTSMGSAPLMAAS
jgi:DNA-binding beta-propeller fold protein YncE